MILPEDVINQYTFEQPNPTKLKEYLINHYNLLTLRKYKEQQQFLTAEEIYQHMSNKIIEFYTQHNNNKVLTNPAPPKLIKPTFWADEHLDTFKTFIQEQCTVTTKPTLKFKELMTTFTRVTNVEATYKWSARYADIFNTLNIKYERVIDPKYAHSTGTYYVYLKLKKI
jgi:hypothetical protein